MRKAKNYINTDPQTTFEFIYRHQLNKSIGGVQKRYLSTRTYHALKMFVEYNRSELFKTFTLLNLSELVSENELTRARNLGEKSLNEIKALLAVVGLSLKKD